MKLLLGLNPNKQGRPARPLALTASNAAVAPARVQYLKLTLKLPQTVF